MDGSSETCGKAHLKKSIVQPAPIVTSKMLEGNAMCNLL
jgi:hypothetical protein